MIFFKSATLVYVNDSRLKNNFKIKWSQTVQCKDKLISIYMLGNDSKKILEVSSIPVIKPVCVSKSRNLGMVKTLLLLTPGRFKSKSVSWAAFAGVIWLGGMNSTKCTHIQTQAKLHDAACLRYM